MKTHQNKKSQQQGAAMILVLSTLLMLMMIATPFLISGRKDYRAATASAEARRARSLATAGVEYARYSLSRTHRGWEQAGRGFGTPRYDGPDEVAVNSHPSDWLELFTGDQVKPDSRYLGDPSGDLWSIKVRDEQSYINCNSAPPFLFGALVGRGRVAADAAPGEGGLTLDEVSGFPKGGGEVIVGGQILTYTKIEGSRLVGADPVRKIRAGAWAVSRRAFDLATWNWSAPGFQSGGARFSTLAMLKSVANVGQSALAETELSSVLRPLTARSHRHNYTGWMAAQSVTADIDPQSYRDGIGQPIQVGNPDYFNAGTKVRIEDPGGVEFGVVVRSTRRGAGGTIYLLEPARGVHDYRTTTIAAELRHPIAVNTAPRDVLVLAMTGLEYNLANGRSNLEKQVSADLAGELADVLIKNRPLRGIEHMVEVLDVLYHAKRGESPEYETSVSASDVDTGVDSGGEMSVEHVAAVVQNAINPCFRGLLNSTMPFTFESGSYYTIEAAASVNDASGSELARYRLRQTLRAAPTASLLMKLDAQLDFEEAITAGRSGRFVQTHPNPVARFVGYGATPEPRLFRFLANFETTGRRGFFPSEQTGDVRLAPSRLEKWGRGGYTEHFDGDLSGPLARGLSVNNTGLRVEDLDPEGWPLSSGAFDLTLTGGKGAKQSSAGGGPATSSPSSGIVADAHGLLPFALEFFIKPTTLSSRPTFFSMQGDDPNSDRVELWYEPSDSSLHFKVHDITIDDPTAGIEEAAWTTWTPSGNHLEDDTWYHIGVHVAGSRPEQSSVHVDGYKRGEARYVSNLASGFSESSTSFEVDNADGWPDEGVFWVGLELVEAYRIAGGSYQVFDPAAGSGNAPLGRGARGTLAVSHSAGETVSLFGYSSLLSTTLLNSSIAQGSTDIVLSQGGSQLGSDLFPFDVVAIKGNRTETIQISPGNTLSVEVYDPAMGNGDIELDGFVGSNVNTDRECLQTTGGYILIVSAFDALSSLGAGATTPANMNPFTIELARYTSRQGNTLQGVSGVPNPPNSNLNGASINLQVNGQTVNVPLQLSRVIHAVKDPSGGPNGRRFAGIIPISVHLTNAQPYREPDISLNAAASGAAGETEPEYIQVGNPMVQPSYKSFSLQAHSIEWIRYYHRDTSANLLLCDSLNGIRNAAMQLLGQLRSVNGKPNSQAISNALGMRNRSGTALFGYMPGTTDTHTTSASVIPVFRVAPVHVPVIAQAGFRDSVTLISDLNGYKDRYSVSWASGDRVALTTNTGKNYDQRALPQRIGERRIYTRMAKFPSGELPLIKPGGGASFIGGDLNGQVGGGGLVDEVRLRGLLDRRFVLWDQDMIFPLGGVTPSPFPLGVSATDVDIPISESREILNLQGAWAMTTGLASNLNVHWLPDGREVSFGALPTGLPQDAGLVQIDDEVIAYRGLVTGPGGSFILEDCTRGFMNTVATGHSFGANIIFYDWRGVTELAQAMQPDSPSVPIEDTQGLPVNGGTVMVNQEMIHFTRILGQTLEMPVRTRGSSGGEEGIFRGRFGTVRGSHMQGDIVLDMPYRYWDRYAPFSDDPELGFYEFAINEPGAFFKRLRWTARFEKARLGMKVLCRLDPSVRWDADPAQTNGRLHIFDTKIGRAQAQSEVQRLMVNGNGMEVRVFFTFESGAFDPTNLASNAWKETGRIENLGVDYLATTRVYQRETIK